MDHPPALQTVYEAVYSLYNCPNSSEREKANIWLNELQKSIYAWKIADEMLQEKKDLESCYFAAQTMRTKIQLSFHELPVTAHESLRDSLLVHLSQINKHTNIVIVMQLCLALADLILQMASWQKPVTDILNKLGNNKDSLWLLLEILIVLPEELNSRYIRLGANRRQQIIAEFEKNGQTVLEFLKICLKTHEDIQIFIKILRCFTSWITINAISLSSYTAFNEILELTFKILKDVNVGFELHEAAGDCLCAILEILEEACLKNIDDITNDEMLPLQELQAALFNEVLFLESPYYLSISNHDKDKTISYCRIFMVLAETFLETMVYGCYKGQQHYSLKILDLALVCVGNQDYEVARITFHFWFRLSESLYQKNKNELTNIFKPCIEKLIKALCNHCQMKPEHLKLMGDDGFAEFRLRVLHLIKDIVFIVGCDLCFQQMFLILCESRQTITWDQTEAALFLMRAIGRKVSPDENDAVPKVIEAILNLPTDTHEIVWHSSVLLLGELCEWINNHPQSIDPIFKFLLQNLQQKSVSGAASIALTNIFTACSMHMLLHFQEILGIAENIDSYGMSSESVIGLLKGIAKILSKLPKEQLERRLKEITRFQARTLGYIIENQILPVKGTKTDPVYWLDRLAAIFRNTTCSAETNEVHPCQGAVTEMWPVITNVFTTYQQDSRIMERCCRCLRFIIRCLGKHSEYLLEPTVKMIVQIYEYHQHSCFLYIGSILVDKHNNNTDAVSLLFEMLKAFIEPTFRLLQQPDGLINHPDTVDDLFRLCSRFIQTTPVSFLHCEVINSILECALLSCNLDHKEANSSVMKFFYCLIHSGRSSKNRSDFSIRHQLIQNILIDKGQTLVTRILHASVFSLSSTMLLDVAELIFELILLNREYISKCIEEALKTMPNSINGIQNVTSEQVLEFHNIVMEADSPKTIENALHNFSRLYQ